MAPLDLFFQITSINMLSYVQNWLEESHCDIQNLWCIEKNKNKNFCSGRLSLNNFNETTKIILFILCLGNFTLKINPTVCLRDEQKWSWILDKQCIMIFFGDLMPLLILYGSLEHSTVPLPTLLFAIIFIPWMVIEILLPCAVLGMGDLKMSVICSLASWGLIENTTNRTWGWESTHSDEVVQTKSCAKRKVWLVLLRKCYLENCLLTRCLLPNFTESSMSELFTRYPFDECIDTWVFHVVAIDILRHGKIASSRV